MLNFYRLPKEIRDLVFKNFSLAELYEHYATQCLENKNSDQVSREALVKFFEKRGAEAYDYQDRLIESWIVYFNKNKTLPLMSNEEDKRFWLASLNTNILNNPEAPFSLKLRVCLLVSKLLPNKMLTTSRDLVLVEVLEESRFQGYPIDLLKAFTTEFTDNQMNKLVNDLVDARSLEDTSLRAASALAAAWPRFQVEITEETFDKLIPILIDENLVHREKALRVLSQAAVHCPPTKVNQLVEALLARLNEEDHLAFVYAVSALTRLAPRIPLNMAQNIALVFLRRLNEESSLLRRCSAKSLDWLLPHFSQEQINSLLAQALEKLKSQNSAQREASPEVLEALFPRVPQDKIDEVADALVVSLIDQKSSVRQGARKALERYSSKISQEKINALVEHSVVTSLLPVNESPALRLRTGALSAIGALSSRITPESIEQIEEQLVAYLLDQGYCIRTGAYRALVPLAPYLSSDHRERILSHLIDPNVFPDTLAKIDLGVELCKLAPCLSEEQLDRVVSVLITHCSDLFWSVRISAVSVSAGLIPYVSDQSLNILIERLTECLSDRALEVRQAAAKSLAVASTFMNSTQLEAFTKESGNSYLFAYKLLAHSRLELFCALKEPDPELEKPDYMCFFHYK